MKHATLVSLTLAIGTLGVAACGNKQSPNSPQDRPPSVSGDATPPASSDAAGATTGGTTSGGTTGGGTTGGSFESSSAASAAPTDPTEARTTGDSVPGTGDTRPVSKVVDDSFITTKTKTALLAEADLKSTNITVETRRGIVTLTGSVPSTSQSDKAATVARNIDGVASVDNRLAVK